MALASTNKIRIMNTAPVMLHVQQLKLRIGNRVLCQPWDGEFRAGERWAILGVNGAGKTTLLHTLAGLRTADAGNVRFRDQLLEQWSRRELSKQLAVLLQNTETPLGGRVIEYVLLGRHPHLHAWQWESQQDYQIAQQALADVELTEFAQRDVNSLSGGERQRLAIATLLAQQPQLMLLDEPVNHLDLRHQHTVLQLLTQRCCTQSCLMLMVIHDPNLALRYCDHAVLMHSNGEVETGSIEEMLNSERLSRLYGYTVKLFDSAAGKVVAAVP